MKRNELSWRARSSAPRETTGARHWMLTAVRPLDEVRGRDWYWLYQCDCGRRAELNSRSVMLGYTRSCGCLQSLKAEWTAKAKGRPPRP